MSKTKKLIEEALSLPVEERAIVADSLLRSLNMPDNTIDAKWAKVARKRLEEIRSGKVKPIPGEEVFDGNVLYPYSLMGAILPKSKLI